MQSGPTAWRSAAANALHRITPKKPRSRARSGQLQCRVGPNAGTALEWAVRRLSARLTFNQPPLYGLNPDGLFHGGDSGRAPETPVWFLAHFGGW
jgi:hypothetical protein